MTDDSTTPSNCWKHSSGSSPDSTFCIKWRGLLLPQPGLPDLILPTSSLCRVCNALWCIYWRNVSLSLSPPSLQDVSPNNLWIKCFFPGKEIATVWFIDQSTISGREPSREEDVPPNHWHSLSRLFGKYSVHIISSEWIFSSGLCSRSSVWCRL